MLNYLTAKVEKISNEPIYLYPFMKYFLLSVHFEELSMKDL
ncbi:hypothetical protein Krodi_0508 [Dokdonia sp. 4H-3-7-5]|nr:hypothetical protein Krodi_0508 [Dokdonia sp. 4H-3-7-5]